MKSKILGFLVTIFAIFAITSCVDAEANRLRTQTLTPQILEKAWIDKWDGKLPVYGQVPTIFKNISK